MPLSSYTSLFAHKDDESRPLNLCLVGCGGFAEFCLEEYSQIEGLKIYSLVDRDPVKLKALADKFGIKETFTNIDDAMDDFLVNLAVIATPPYLHYSHTMKALLAEKHVLCEKPLALNLEDARRLFSGADALRLKLSNNYVMRFNPLYRWLRDLIKSGILGKTEHFIFRNFAQNETLPADHWFWDKESSGGIFVEHGIHFFDIMNFVFGKGEPLSCYGIKGKDSGRTDRVTANLIYPGGVQGTFYHSFTRKRVTERNYLDLGFERGYLTFHQWIPTGISGEVWLSSVEAEKFQELLKKINEYTSLGYSCLLNKLHRVKGQYPVLTLGDKLVGDMGSLHDQGKPRREDIIPEYIPDERWFPAGESEIRENYNLVLSVNGGKPAVYREAIRKRMEDFILTVNETNHSSLLSMEDILESLQTALDCENLMTVREE